jgi:hypothetical protein
MTQMDDVMSRAFAAYFKQAKRDRVERVDQPSNTSSVMSAGERDYAVLHNGCGTLAVYRIRNNGGLKRLKRWPAELDWPWGVTAT